MNAMMAARQGLSSPVSIDRIREVPQSVRQLGSWSATLATLFSIGYGVTLIVSMVSLMGTAADTQVGAPAATSGWQGIESFVATFQPIQMLSLVPSLFLVPAFIVLMVSIHHYAAPDKKIWSELGIAFSLIYAVMASINYLLQLTAVRLSILNRETDGLAMFVMGNPHSLFWVLASCYVFMNLAMLFAAPVFDGGRLERWIRWLFIANGVTVITSLVGIALDTKAVYLLVSLVPWCVVFAPATALVAVLFRQAPRAAV
jgi:hypothetical protein